MSMKLLWVRILSPHQLILFLFQLSAVAELINLQAVKGFFHYLIEITSWNGNSFFTHCNCHKKIRITKNGKKKGKKQSLTVKVVGLGFNPEGDFFHVSADSCILLLGKNSFVDPFPILFVETEFRRVLESTV